MMNPLRLAIAFFVCFFVAAASTQQASAQAAGTNPDRCRGIACALKGGGIRIVIKPAIKRSKAKPRVKPRVKKRRAKTQKAKPRNRRAKRIPPSRRVKKKVVRRNAAKPTPTPQPPTGPSWEGLPERPAITLTQQELQPLAGTVLLRLNAENLAAQSIDLQTVDTAALAAILEIEPFQVRSIQRRFLPGAIVNLSPDDAARLAASPLVARLSPDTVIKPASAENRRLSWGLDRLDQAKLPLDGKFERRKRKGNLRVYLLDSGVDRRHPEFGDRVVFGASFVPVIPASANTFCKLHGTEMASLVMGKNMGIAADIRLIDVTVLPCLGQETGTASALIEGLYWIAEREDALRPRKLSVANLSLTGPKSLDVNEWVDALSGMGIAVVAAAGNQGEDACNFSPASASTAITVGALDHKDQLAPFSNKGKCVKLHAPGVKVTAASAANHKLNVATNGTSAATAYVSGILASNLASVEEGRASALLTANGINLSQQDQSLILAQSASAIVPECRVAASIRTLNLRKQPSTRAATLARLPSGTMVEVKALKDDWAEILTQDDQSGWVAIQANGKVLLSSKDDHSACR